MKDRPLLTWADAPDVSDAPDVVVAKWDRALRPALAAYARARLGAAAGDADELVQEAFLELLLRVRADGADSIQNPYAWLRRVVMHRAAHWHRARKILQKNEGETRRRWYDERVAEESVELAYVHARRSDAAVEAFRALPPRERRAVSSWARRRPLREIAAEVGTASPRRASAFVWRILRKLAQQVSNG